MYKKYGKQNKAKNIWNYYQSYSGTSLIGKYDKFDYKYEDPITNKG